jgi:putative FmdB family regulatory protein
MPLYTYQCDHHGEFSAWGTMSEGDAPRPCPTCTEPALRALARPAVGGGSGDESMACGDGGCAPTRPSFGGHACGAGCVH